jgi:tripartite-type tricarboxylate transporter receptor subunit TctC
MNTWSRYRSARLCYLAAAAALSICSAVVSYAQGFPSKPVRIIVPFSAGSGSDVFARTLGPKFTEAWGQQIVVENREGAGGIIGAQLVRQGCARRSHAPACRDAVAVSPSLYAKAPYDPLRDFTAVGGSDSFRACWSLHPTLP